MRNQSNYLTKAEIELLETVFDNAMVITGEDATYEALLAKIKKINDKEVMLHEIYFGSTEEGQ